MHLIKAKRFDWTCCIAPDSAVLGGNLTPKSLRTQINLNFAISTVNRNVPYIHQMLASMYLGGFPQHFKIHLFVSGPDVSYLNNYKQHENIIIHATPDQEWQKIKHLPNKFKASFNYLRCLSLTEHENTLAFEDDVIFQHNWYEKMMTCLSHIEEDGYKDFIFTLFSVNKGNSTKTYYANPKMGWACSQGIYYPKTVLSDIREYLQNVTEEVAETQIEPSNPPFLNAYDMIIKEWLLTHVNSHIFCPVESLLQHVGVVTAGGTGETIVSSVFL